MRRRIDSTKLNDKMTETAFWELIEASPFAVGAWSKQREFLLEKLKALPRSDLVDYTIHYEKHRRKAFTPALLCGAFLLNHGWLSYDAFLDFTDCLVATSRRISQAIVEDPDRLLEHLELADCPEIHFSQLGLDAFELQGANWSELLDEIDERDPSPPPSVIFRDRIGLEIVDKETASELVPRLYAQFGEKAFEGVS